MNRFKEKYLGDAAFYKMVLMIAFPIMIQNGITNFVGLLDNIMVGQLGTEQMSGVAIVNQLMMVFNVCIFGAVSSASIFSAQFFGQKNYEGVKETFRFKLIFCVGLTIVSVILFIAQGGWLIERFLHDNGMGDIALTYDAGHTYLMVMLIGILPYAVTQTYASTLREAGRTFQPMVAGITAVFINLILNYVFIFGNFGAPKLGVAGAALATIISRFVELAVVVIWTHVSRFEFMIGIYSTFRVPSRLIKQIVIKGTPLFINEAMWSGGMALLNQCYSYRGLDAVAAINISTTVSNLFNIVFIAIGSSISIVVGQLLGAGRLEEAVETDRKMIFFSVMCCVGVGAVMLVLAPIFPQIYNTTDEVKYLATIILRIAAVFMPFYAFYHASYFTLRSGGKTLITFLFDSCYLWVINIPTAFVLSRFTAMPVIPIYFICQCLEITKGIVGFILIKKRVWVNNVVSELE